MAKLFGLACGIEAVAEDMLAKGVRFEANQTIRVPEVDLRYLRSAAHQARLLLGENADVIRRLNAVLLTGSDEEGKP
jgi:hypothetical protein